MKFSVVIVAAGSGARMGLGYNKMLYPLENKKTIIENTVAVFLQDKRCKQIIVVGSDTDILHYQKLLHDDKITFAVGGETRQESVYNGLQEVSEDYVLIHDGARPWVTEKNISDLVHMLEKVDACLLMVPVKDTIKQVENGKVKHTYDRSTLWQAQTPQAFKTTLIKDCYEKAKMHSIQATDDAQLVELCGNEEVVAVEGSYENRKVTTMEDVVNR